MLVHDGIVHCILLCVQRELARNDLRSMPISCRATESRSAQTHSARRTSKSGFQIPDSELCRKGRRTTGHRLLAWATPMSQRYAPSSCALTCALLTIADVDCDTDWESGIPGGLTPADFQCSLFHLAMITLELLRGPLPRGSPVKPASIARRRLSPKYLG